MIVVNHSVGPHDEAGSHKKKKGCNVKPFLLMLALSVHSFFEGLACGVELNLTQVINICVAIVVHKCAAGTTLGVALVKTFPDDFTLVRWLVFTFAIATPLGVLIGMIIA